MFRAGGENRKGDKERESYRLTTRVKGREMGQIRFYRSFHFRLAASNGLQEREKKEKGIGNLKKHTA